MRSPKPSASNAVEPQTKLPWRTPELSVVDLVEETEYGGGTSNLDDGYQNS